MEAQMKMMSAYAKTVAVMIRQMEKQGIMKPPASPWSSPIALVPKDGTRLSPA